MDIVKPPSIKIVGFSGMNNVVPEENYSGDQALTAVPRVILNADVTPSKTLKKRSGYKLMVNLPNVHSMWSTKGVMLCASEGFLYRFYPDGSTIKLCALPGDQQDKLSYTLVNSKVYISNSQWTGILESTTNEITPWGLPIPEQPVVLVISNSGSLKSGKYFLCYAFEDNGEVGAPSAFVEVIIAQDNSSISLLNKVQGTLSWITDPDGNLFYLTNSDNSIITSISSVEPLPSISCTSVRPMRFIRRAFGRMWGAVDNFLVYSEPYKYGLFRFDAFFKQDSNILMLAFVEGGIYIGMTDKTIFLSGSDIPSMKETVVGSGVVNNLLVYCNNVPDLGNSIPIWVSKDGLVSGSHSGQISSITTNKVQFPTGVEGAALSRIVNGQPQVLTSFKQARPQGSGVGFGDSTTCEVVRNGRAIQP